MSARAAWRLEDLGFDPVYRYQPGKADWIAQGWSTEGHESSQPTVGTLATREVPTCRADERVGDVRERVEREGWDACVVVHEAGIFQGLIRRSELDAEPGQPAATVMYPQARTFRPDMSPDGPLDYMNEHGLDSVVVSSGDGVLVGLLLRADAERQVNAAA